MICKRISRRILTALLAAAMLLPLLASCGEPTDPADTTPSAQTTAAEEAEETVPADELPSDLYYDGEEIVFITYNPMTYDELTGDAVEDVIYERNKAVEERLGVEIKAIREETPIEKVITAVNGGSSDYDVMVEMCWRAAPKFTGNYFYNLQKTEYLDLEKPWWNQSFNDVVTYNGITFGVTGAMVLSLYRRTYVTVFNKALFDNANQSYLYEHVENGTWTLDKQASLVPLFYQDNGNAQKDMEGDIYGFVSNDFIFVDPYWASCEVEIIRKNSDGDYEWVFESAKLYDMAEKVLALYYGTGDAAYIEHDDYQAEATVIKVFSGGYAAMGTLVIQQLEDSVMRNMEQEYGVVPIPKYSEEQTTYYSQMHDGFTIACIPTTVKAERADMLSAVLEAMSSTSYRIVRPVYYETTLRTKLAQDPQSAAMMDLIINNIRIDAGFVYSHSMNSFHQGFQQLMDGGQNDAISRYKRLTAAAQRSLDRLVSQLDKLASEQ